METFFEGARLGAWGIGLLLTFMVAVRLANAAHLYLSEKIGPVPAPIMRYSALDAERPLLGMLSAMAVGLVALFSFSVPIFENHVWWLKIDGVNEALSILATHVLILLQLYFINRLLAEPKEKLVWAGGWYAFSMGLACLSLV